VATFHGLYKGIGILVPLELLCVYP
jgi:hypothetical protein